MIGLGAHWGEWLAEIKKLPKIKRWSVKTVRYTPQQWRQALWGRRWGNKPSDQWDAETIAYARATWPAFEFDRDSAVAACIALVASRDPNVHRLPGCAAKEGK